MSRRWVSIAWPSATAPTLLFRSDGQRFEAVGVGHYRPDGSDETAALRVAVEWGSGLRNFPPIGWEFFSGNGPFV